MADRIVVLNAGYIAQVGAPLELYHKPQNTFVAGFIGNPRMNFLPVTCTAVTEAGAVVAWGDQSLTIPVQARADLVGQSLSLGIRPEHITLGANGATLTMTPSVVEQLGQQTIGYANLPGIEASFCIVLPGDQHVTADQPVTVGFQPADCHLFTADGQAVERRLNLSAQPPLPR